MSCRDRGTSRCLTACCVRYSRCGPAATPDPRACLIAIGHVHDRVVIGVVEDVPLDANRVNGSIGYELTRNSGRLRQRRSSRQKRSKNNERTRGHTPRARLAIVQHETSDGLVTVLKGMQVRGQRTVAREAHGVAPRADPSGRSVKRSARSLARLRARAIGTSLPLSGPGLPPVGRGFSPVYSGAVMAVQRSSARRSYRS